MTVKHQHPEFQGTRRFKLLGRIKYKIDNIYLRYGRGEKFWKTLW